MGSRHSSQAGGGVLAHRVSPELQKVRDAPHQGVHVFNAVLPLFRAITTGERRELISGGDLGSMRYWSVFVDPV